MAQKGKGIIGKVFLLAAGGCMAALGIYAMINATRNLWLAYTLLVVGLVAVGVALLWLTAPARGAKARRAEASAPQLERERRAEPPTASAPIWPTAAAVRAERQKTESAAAKAEADKPEPVAEQDEEEDEEIMVPERIDGRKRKYVYQDVRIYVPSLTDEQGERVAGKIVTLRQEPENGYDENAIAVWYEDCKVGYLNKGQLQDMANDYLRRKDPIFAAVTFVGSREDEVTVELCLAFYPERKRSGNVKRFKLTGNTSEEKQDQIFCVSEDDPVEYSYDSDKEKFEAICGGGSIGYFPKSASALLEDDPEAVIAEITENDQGKSVVYVDVDA